MISAIKKSVLIKKDISTDFFVLVNKVEVILVILLKYLKNGI